MDQRDIAKAKSGLEQVQAQSYEAWVSPCLSSHTWSSYLKRWALATRQSVTIILPSKERKSQYLATAGTEPEKSQACDTSTFQSTASMENKRQRCACQGLGEGTGE